jgi:hypothetical protein
VNYKRRNARLVLQNKKRGKRQKKRRTESARGNRRGKRNWPSKRSPSPKRRANHAVALASAGAVPLRRVVAAAAIAALQIVDHHPPVVARLTLPKAGGPPVPEALREAGVAVRESNALQAQAASRRPTRKVEVVLKAWTEIGKVVGIRTGRRDPILEIERKAVKPKTRRKRKWLVLQKLLHWKRAVVIARPPESKTLLVVPRNEQEQSQTAGIVVEIDHDRVHLAATDLRNEQARNQAVETVPIPDRLLQGGTTKLLVARSEIRKKGPEELQVEVGHLRRDPLVAVQGLRLDRGASRTIRVIRV